MSVAQGGWALRVYVDFVWVGAGQGNTAYGPAANIPGVGASQSPGVNGDAQTMRFQQGEQIAVAGAAPTAAELVTALTAAATDIGGQITAAPAKLAQIGAWSTGGP